MWIRIEGFIINLDNVTNINIQREYVYISFTHGAIQLGVPGTDDNIYWNSLAFEKKDIPDSAWKIIKALPKNSWDSS